MSFSLAAVAAAPRVAVVSLRFTTIPRRQQLRYQRLRSEDETVSSCEANAISAATPRCHQ